LVGIGDLDERLLDWIVAVCLSSIRHVRDRVATFRELRRVVHDRLVIVEFDGGRPVCVAAHANRVGTALR